MSYNTQQPQLWTYEGDSDEEYALDVLSEMSPNEQRAILSGNADVELLGVDWKKFWKGVGKAASGGVSSLVKKIRNKRKSKKKSGGSTTPITPPFKRSRRSGRGWISRRSRKKNMGMDTLLLVGGVGLAAFLLMSKKGGK